MIKTDKSPKEIIVNYWNLINHYNPELDHKTKAKLLRTINTIEKYLSIEEIEKFIVHTKKLEYPIGIKTINGITYISKRRIKP